MKIFEKSYDYESLYDLPEEIADALDETQNKIVKKLPKDEYNYILGTFKVTLEWLPPEQEE